MPKLVDYPRSSLKKSFQLAEAVDQLGGTCTRASCADKLGMKVGGGFNRKIGGAIKFNLIESQKGSLTVSELYKLIKHSYNEEEKQQYQIEVFLNPPIFRKIFERFKNKQLPVEMLDKLLIREFNVDEREASRVAKYFVNGAKYLDIINGENFLVDSQLTKKPEKVIQGQKQIELKDSTQILSDINKNYIVHISGPEMDSKIIINEKDDIEIVNVMLKKVVKKLEMNNNNKNEVVEEY